MIGASLPTNVVNIVLFEDTGTTVSTWQAQNQTGWHWIGKLNKTWFGRRLNQIQVLVRIMLNKLSLNLW